MPDTISKLNQTDGLTAFWRNRYVWPEQECVAVIPAGTVVLSRMDGQYYQFVTDHPAVLFDQSHNAMEQRVGKIVRDGMPDMEFWISDPFGKSIEGQVIQSPPPHPEI